jgi:hypothetical protein
MSEALISNEYQQQLADMHMADEYWGTSAGYYADLVTSIINRFSVKTILDYGSGKGTLHQYLSPDHQVAYALYDPAIPGISAIPRPREMVVCLDVLEHIEPDLIDNVLKDIQRCAQKLAFINISLVPARKHLPDGRNAHILLRSSRWWTEKLLEYWDIRSLSADHISLWAVLFPRGANGNHQL